jgi:predicted RNA-binding Zn ribbon-like protein
LPELAPRYDSWAEVMAALEAANASATRLDEAGDDAADAPWTAPTHLGPMPSELRERADRLLADQRASIRNLEDLHRETGRHLAAVRAVPSPRDGQSVYLDVSG